MLAFSPLIFGLMRKFPASTIFALMGLTAIMLVLPLYLDFSGVSQIIDERFGSFGEDGRVSMYDIALTLINDRPVLGYGSGYFHDYGGHKMHQVHNLFLGAWIQGGLICLLLAISYQGFLLTLYIKRLGHYIGEPSQICLLGILVLPLFRTQISGSGGNFNLPEWICVSIVLALFARAPQAQSVAPEPEPPKRPAEPETVSIT